MIRHRIITDSSKWHWLTLSQREGLTEQHELKFYPVRNGQTNSSYTSLFARGATLHEAFIEAARLCKEFDLVDIHNTFE